MKAYKRVSSISAILVAVFAVGLLFVSLSGCRFWDNESGEGPAERAGRELDRAAENTGKGLSEAADKVGQDVSNVARGTRENIDHGTERTGRGLDNTTKAVGEEVEQVGEDLQD